MHANFQEKQTTLTFSTKICPKMSFGVGIPKIQGPDLESASLRYHVYQFSDKTNTFEFLGPNLPKNGFWGRNFKSGFGINTSNIPCVPIFSENG